MKKLSLFLFAVVFLSTYAKSQVVINEIIPDPGNYDGQGAEWTELYNPSAIAVDIGKWILTDGEEIISIPAGTILAPGGYFLIYNGNFFACNTCNWDASILTTLNSSNSLNLATCGCTNQTAASGYAVTWDNGLSPTNQDRLVLFRPDGTISDAVYYGSGERYAPAASPIPESVYAPGGSLTQIGANTYDGSINFDVPALTNPVWEFIGPVQVGCTTSFGRISDGGSSWFIDYFPSPSLTNTTNDYSILVNGSAIPPSSLGGIYVINTCTPATYNFNVSVPGYNKIYRDADGDDGDPNDNTTVPAFPNLEGGSSKKGSTVNATGGLVVNDAGWNLVSNTGGVVTVDYTSASVAASTLFTLRVKENTQGTVDNPNETGFNGSAISGSGVATECYVEQKVQINFINAITAASFTCTNGNVTATTTPASGVGVLLFELMNGGTVLESNSTGKFFIPTGSPATGIRVTQTGTGCGGTIMATGTICTATIPCPAFTAYDVCSSASGAVCPGETINLSLTGTNLADGSKIDWVIDSDNDNDVYDEPASSVISTQNITNAEPIPSGSVMINEVLFNATLETLTTNGEAWELAGTPGTDIGCMYMTDGDFVIQIPSGTLMPATGFYVIGGNSYSPQIGQPAANLTLAATTGLGNLTNSTGSGTGNGEFLTLWSSANSFINGVYWGPVSVGLPSASTVTNRPQSSGSPSLIVAGTGCGALPPSATIQSNIQTSASSISLAGNINASEEQSIELSTDLGASWQVSATPGSTINTLGSSNVGSVNTLSPACASYVIPVSSCNSTINIKPRYSAVPTGCTPGSSTPTLPTRSFTVTCPTAAISGQSAVCSGSATTIPVTLSNTGTCTQATVAFSIDGVPQTPQGPLTISSGQVLLTGITTAGVVTINSVTLSGGCGAGTCTVSPGGEHIVTIKANPAAPSATSNNACIGEVVALTTTGADVINWYSDAAGTSFLGSGVPFYYTASSPAGAITLYVKSVDPDNGCQSTLTPVTVNVYNPPALSVSTVNCATGAVQLATTGSDLNFKLLSKNGTGGDVIGATNTTGTFNLIGSSTATFSLTNTVTGCRDVLDVDFISLCGQTLPLSFIEFTAIQQSGGVMLRWKTTSEEMVKTYSIEYSIDGINFQRLSNIPSGRGALSQYQYFDAVIRNTTKIYYRIVATNDNGSGLNSSIRLVKFDKGFAVSLMPNPVNDRLVVSVSGNSQNLVIVRNSIGQILFRQNVPVSVFEINTSAWASGIYTIEVENKLLLEKSVLKFVKQ